MKIVLYYSVYFLVWMLQREKLGEKKYRCRMKRIMKLCPQIHSTF